jgi:phosphate:Na+ symporter
VRSSAATIGIALSFATSGLMNLDGAMPMIFGANIGTAATALIAAVGSNADARRVAAAHAIFKVIGVLIFLPLSVVFADLVRQTTDDPARQIANAHSLFNLIVALLFLPFTRIAADVFTRVIPDTGRTELGAMYLNPNVLDTPAVALGQAVREVLRMGDAVLQSLRDTIVVYERDDEQLMKEVIRRDDLIDRLEEDIKQYLVKLGEHALTEEQSERESALLFTVVNLEEIGDVIEKELMELAEKKIRGHYRFSPQGWKEIVDLHAMVIENLELAISALATQDHSIAEKVVRHKSNINLMERRLRQTHMQRLHEGLRETIDTSSIHLDVLAGLKRVNSLIAGIGYAVLGQHDAE